MQALGQTHPKKEKAPHETLSEKFHDKKTIHLAKEYFRVEEYGEAAKYYEELLKIYPNNTNFVYYLGVCYFKMNNKEKAFYYFNQCRKDTSNGHLEFNYYIARSYQLGNHFEEAIDYYTIYKDTLLHTKTPAKYEHKASEVEDEIHRCQLAMELLKKPVDVTVINIGNVVNSEFDDYMPVLSVDEGTMMFTSRRPNTVGGGIDPSDGMYYEDIYTTNKKDSSWTAPKDMGAPINTPGHDATVCISADGQKLFIYRSQAHRFSQHLQSDIFISEKKDTGWTVPHKISYNVNTEHAWEPSGSLSATEDKFYFSSNRPHPSDPTKTDRDIYVVEKDEKGVWGQPKSLGAPVNSDYEEDGPFIHPDGRTLYFSSNGKQSIGGFDIFKTVFNDSTKTWSEPENIGFPFNTPGDDIYIVWSADGRRAYFSSVRDDSYGGKDIYMATNLKEKHSLSIIVGRVFDNETKLPLEAEIIVVDDSTDQQVGVFTSEKYTGKFSIALPSGNNYGISIAKDGYLFHSENLNVPHLAEYSEVRKDIYLNPIKDGTAEILKNVFFDTDKNTLRKESKAELDKLYALLEAKPHIHVEIAGYTDDRSSPDYNQVLSEARAAAVVQYLLDKGLDKNKIMARGFGEQNPIASNETEEGRQQNRRIEYMILDTTDDAHSKYLAIKDSTFLHPDDPMFKPLLEDFKGVYIKQQEDKVPKMGEYLYYQVFFPFNESNSITEYSTTKLRSLIGYMNHYPKTKIKIVSHADFFGDSATSMKLARERGKLVYDYLIKNGLDKARLDLTSEAEEKAIIEEDSKEGNKKNRRVEFLVEDINFKAPATTSTKKAPAKKAPTKK